MELVLDIERPVAGGDMLARDEGRIVFVAGAIPGERVRAVVTRKKGDLRWAEVREVVEPSPDRREPGPDPACGGRVYAHVRYERQLRLKAEIIGDAFRRLARHPLTAPVAVQASPETGYRMRARLHVGSGRLGFVREGSRHVCDAGPKGQLSRAAAGALDQFASAAAGVLTDCESVLLSEQVDDAARVLVCALRPGAEVGPWIGRPLTPGLTGVVVLTAQGHFVAAGEDRLEESIATARLVRRGASFFQANRFLVRPLLDHVLAAAQGETFVDLYAGVGLFSVPMAMRGQRGVAVEGDRFSAGDLAANASQTAGRLVVRAEPVERMAGAAGSPDATVVVVDPPRTGLSPTAVEGLLRWRAPRVVYVSCDAPTLARDAGRLCGDGYTLTSVAAFDMFPNTAHVECVAVFDR